MIISTLDMKDKVKDFIGNVAPQEKSLVIGAYQALLDSIKIELSEDEKIKIQDAFEFAWFAHRTQIRKSGEPYILHPLEVAMICSAEMKLGATAIVSALMHDVVEDCPKVLEMDKDAILAYISQLSGANISLIIDGLTKLDKGLFKEYQVESIRRVLVTFTKDIHTLLVKIADRLHNMRTIDAMDATRQHRIAAETQYVYIPLAHRLGLYAIKTELEDVCMRVNEPDAYSKTVEELEKTQGQRDEYIAKFIAPLQEALKEADYPVKIYGRVKAVSSIYNKIKNKNVDLKDIYDIFAVRIVVDVPLKQERAACWNAYSVITEHYTPIIERLKDWVSVPKSNGYESLHITVMGPEGKFVEVQIRSKRMDEIAEVGLAAHWKYKGQKATKQNSYEDLINVIRDYLSNPNLSAAEGMNYILNDLGEEIYVFTPKGEIRFLPNGSTALDFAFNIHSELGEKCRAVKIGDKIVPLSYKLKNGDQVFVIKDANQKPTEDWLKIVVTSKAQARIRQALRDQKRKYAEDGREELERKMKNWKLDFEENIEILVKYYGFKNRVDFYYDIAEKNIDLSDLKHLKIDNGRFVITKTDETKEGAGSTNSDDTSEFFDLPTKKEAKPRVLIDGKDALLESYSYILSSCCTPVPGDSIFAYNSSKGGFNIHRVTCPNAQNLQTSYGYRIHKAEWGDSASLSSKVTVTLEIIGVDDVGVIQQITKVITSEHGINMRSIEMVGEEGAFKGKVQVVIKNKDELNRLITSLRKLSLVSFVKRLDT